MRVRACVSRDPCVRNTVLQTYKEGLNDERYLDFSRLIRFTGSEVLFNPALIRLPGVGMNDADRGGRLRRTRLAKSKGDIV